MSNREPRMTVDLDIPHDAAERERLRLANLCECPTCGRMHKPLGFGDPPGVAVQNKALQNKIERLQAAVIQIRVTCDGNAEPTCDKGMALAFVRNVADHALAFGQSSR